MAKKAATKKTQEQNIESTDNTLSPTIADIGWTDYVLESLSEDEKIKGNPTTDGLRRIFETIMDCVITQSVSEVCQSPYPDNGNRATVVHSLTYVLKDSSTDPQFNTITVNGAADVYWGNCDKIFRNYPVAVAETRAEGRALRRALRLRKVVAAEEIAEEIEDHPDKDTAGKITNNQINFIDVLAKRLNINITNLLKKNGMEEKNIYTISHADAVKIIRRLSKYQQDLDSISEDILDYTPEWK